MSKHQDEMPKGGYRIKESSGMWAKAWQASALLAVIGAVVSGVAWMGDAPRFGYSYLFGFFTVLTLVFGALFLVIIQHMTAGHWGVSTRRIVEVVMSAAPVVALLAIPLALGVASGQFHMYDEWMASHDHADHADHEGHEHDEHEGHEDGDHEDHEGEGHDGDPEDDGAETGSLVPFGPSTAHAQDGVFEEEEEHTAHTPQETALHHHILEHKSGYLNAAGWGVRGLVYLLIWILLAMFYWKTSLKQDESKDLKLTLKMKKWAPMSGMAFGLTLTFASFDWLMSLEPSWYSTIFGVVIFGGSSVGILALTIIISISLYQNRLVGEAINVEHVHDLGKLMFGFMCFWTYTSFSQWMLIWYAGIPEEAIWFHKRWEGGWHVWTVMLVFGHFLLPFFFHISRMVKRRLPLAMFGAVWLLVMHVADVYWYVLPQAGRLSLGFGDVGALLLCGGVFFTYVLLMMKRVPLIAIGDPRLPRALHHHQSH